MLKHNGTVTSLVLVFMEFVTLHWYFDISRTLPIRLDQFCSLLFLRLTTIKN